MMLINKIYSLIGIAKKAGYTISGESLTEKAIQNKKAFIVIIASDASNNTKEKFQKMCYYYKIPIYICGDKASLGHAIGKPYRASIAILDQGLSEAITKQLDMLY